MQKWTSSQAWSWHQQHGWLVGFNYLPRTAGNWVEMWQEQDFSPETIDQEMGWAASLGYNSLRTNLSFQVWHQDREGMLERLDTFLDICEKHRIGVMLTPMDDCEFSNMAPSTGQQHEPKTGIHNSIAVGSPGRDFVCTPALWPELEKFIKDIVSRYSEDHRIICWDLYNEPTNRMVFSDNGDDAAERFPESYSHELMIRTFEWAREQEPTQPLTVGAWHLQQDSDADGQHYDHATDQLAMELSDVISFHAYTNNDQMKEIIKIVKGHNRPVLCTEWMARHLGSTIKDQLPILKDNNVGCFQWGLVAGKTQTNIPWPHLDTKDFEEGLWFHDILHPDGSPFREEEKGILEKHCKN